MKKNKFFYFAVMLCTLAFGLTSCQKDDDSEGGSGSSSIVGYWEPYSTDFKIYYEGELLYEEEAIVSMITVSSIIGKKMGAM